MLDQVLAVFEITPDYDLDVMQPNQTITTITTNVMNRLEEVIQAENQILSWSMVIQQRPLLLVWRLFTIKLRSVMLKLVYGLGISTHLIPKR